MTPYLTETEADLYFKYRVGSEDWESASKSNQTKALGHATRLINRLAYKGTPITGQSNAFPREGYTVVPEQIKDACCEIAISLIAGTDTQLETENLWLRSHSYSGVSSSRSEANPEYVIAGIPSAEAWRLISPYLRDNKQIEVHRQ